MSGPVENPPNVPGSGKPGNGHADPRRSVADSPWFWVGLFACWAVVGLVVVAPKYAKRHGRLAVQQQGREYAWKDRLRGNPAATADGQAERKSDVDSAPNGADPSRHAFTLLPLLIVFAGLSAAAALGLRTWRSREAVVAAASDGRPSDVFRASSQPCAIVDDGLAR
jgi:hypothetical protein